MLGTPTTVGVFLNSMKRNSEIKLKVIECDSRSNMVVLQTKDSTFTFTSKEFVEFIKTAPLVKEMIQKKDSIYKEVAENILMYLNNKADRKLPITDKNLSFIIARLSEGEDSKLMTRVIDWKCYEWKDDFKMKKFLRPETIFNQSKYQNYKAELLDIQQNPKEFKNYVATKDHQKRISKNSTYDPLDSMPD